MQAVLLAVPEVRAAAETGLAVPAEQVIHQLLAHRKVIMEVQVHLLGLLQAMAVVVVVVLVVLEVLDLRPVVVVVVVEPHLLLQDQRQDTLAAEVAAVKVVALVAPLEQGVEEQGAILLQQQELLIPVVAVEVGEAVLAMAPQADRVL
jgi:hypothetical protein